MIDVCEQASSYLRSCGFPAQTRRLDSLNGIEGIAVRRLPSTVENEYMTSKTVAFLYQVVAKYRSEEVAVRSADDMARLLDGAKIKSGNGSYKFTSQEIYTYPQLLSTERGFYAVEFRVRAFIEIERS